MSGPVTWLGELEPGLEHGLGDGLSDGLAAVQGPGWRHAAALAAAYALAASLSIYLSRQPGDIANVWYANAIGVAVLMRADPTRWPMLLAGLAGGNVVANWAWGDSLATAATFVPPNLVEMALAAWLLRRAGVHRSALRSMTPLLQLLLYGALVPQLVAATLGAAILAAKGVGAFTTLWQSWAEGSMIGALSLLPLAAMVVGVDPTRLRRRLLTWRVAALVPLSVGLSLLCLAHLPYPWVFLSVPLLCAAVLVDAVAVALLTLLVSVTAAVALALGVLATPPMTRHWQEVFVFLAYAAALVPAQLLAAAVAELRDSHARLAARTTELRRANEGLEQFVHIAAHDMREPLNTMTQFTGLIRAEHAHSLPPEASTYLDLVHRAATRMRTLLDDMLNYARLQAAGPAPHEAVDLDAVMAEVRQTLAGRLRERAAVLQVDPLPVVQGHPAMLTLLLQNLVGNAIKFVPPGRVPMVRVHVRQAGGMAQLCVSDNGIGIDEADLPKLFKPFQRLNLQRQFEGTGLGLALCRQVADAHGTRIEVRSEPGRGSEFSLWLPLAD